MRMPATDLVTEFTARRRTSCAASVTSSATPPGRSCQCRARCESRATGRSIRAGICWARKRTRWLGVFRPHWTARSKPCCLPRASGRDRQRRRRMDQLAGHWSAVSQPLPWRDTLQVLMMFYRLSHSSAWPVSCSRTVWLGSGEAEESMNSPAWV